MKGNFRIQKTLLIFLKVALKIKQSDELVQVKVDHSTISHLKIMLSRI
jgi:hypothetical protein